MTERDTESTSITIHGRDNLIAHIEGLQGTLTKRNAQIAELEERLLNGPAEPERERELRKAYKQGWQDCAIKLKSTTNDLAQVLRKVDQESFELFLEGDRMGGIDQ